MKPTEAMDRSPLQKPKSTSPKWLIYLGLAAIVFATLIAYLPAIRAGFIWDDDRYVSENHLLGNFSGLGKIWSLKLTTAADNHRHLISYTPQYYPLVFSTFWLESRLWDQSNPTGFHVVNVLLHIANALLVWLICHRLGFSWAYLAAVIFALHPVGVESVAWITERKNVLSGLFYLLVLLSYLRFEETRRKLFYFTALSCFVLALLSKTVTCTLPVILLLILWLRHRRLSWSDLARLIPFFAVGALLGLFTAYLERYKVGAIGAEWEIAFWQRWVIAGRAVFFYAWKLLWPVNLIFIYPRWNPEKFSLLDLLWPAAVIVLAMVLWSRRKAIGRAPLAAWAGFIITLFPALGFFDVYPFRFSFVADHFQYLASLFFIALFVGLGRGLYKRFCPQGFKSLLFPGARILLTSVVLLLLGYLTYAQAHMYEDVEGLWKTTIRRNPGARIAWNNLGMAYFVKGNLEQAIRVYSEAIELNPKHAKFYYGRASAYLVKADYNRAIRDSDKAIEFNPRYAKAYSNRGLAYHGKGDLEQAIRDYNQAIQLNPKDGKAYYNRGRAYSDRRDYNRAIRDLDKAVELDPKNAYAHYNRGLAYQGNGQYHQAIRDFDKALELNPRLALAHKNIGLTLLRQDKAKEAISHYRQALRLQSDWPEVLNDLAWILATHKDDQLRHGTEAIRLAQRACQLTNYRHSATLDSLAAAYAEAGQFDKAVRTAERAIQLALAGGKRKLAKDIQGRLDLYKLKRPYRESFIQEGRSMVEPK